MDVGQFDRRIELQRVATVDDGYSVVSDGWVTLAIVWAKYIPMSGSEIMAAAQNSSFANIRLKIRRDSIWSDLNAADRLLFEDVAHNIVSVRQEGRGFFLIDAVVRGDG